MNSVRRIIITGPSGAGKTSVATEVARELGVPVISMDNYRAKSCRGGEYVTHAGKQVRNYEAVSNWDGHAIACKLRALIQNDQGFVAEGNHLLAYPAIAALPGIETFYLEVPFAVSLARRKTRNRGTAPDWSFALIGREQTTLIVEPQKNRPDIVVIDGTYPTPEIVALILSILRTRANVHATLAENRSEYS